MEHPPMTEDPLGPDGFICPRCGAEFADDLLFKDHVSSHVTGAPDAEYVCTICGQSYYSQAELDEHAANHMPESIAA
jgi:DNA-directed RNA polymerase subunit RPC12/RpoP